jgi:hypothetical protein
VNKQIQDQVAKCQKEVAELQNPSHKPETSPLEKFRVKAVEISPNVVEVSRGK